MNNRPVALSIAGSDSGGGAGIQADLRVMSRIGVFGTTAITAVTAQNLAGVSAVAALPVADIVAQIDAVCATAESGGFGVRYAKSGMLWSADIIVAVADAVRRHQLSLVVDPVMVATSGARLLEQSAVVAYREALLPNALLVTPNLDEALVLLEREDPIASGEMADVAAALAGRLGCPVLLKGGHLDGRPNDVLWDGSEAHRFVHARVADVNSHGSGCMLSAAIVAHLALGARLVNACHRGLAFVHDALQEAVQLPGTKLAAIERAEAKTDHILLEPA
jgi:hydroxymethylpyrimidine kinase/phosphomethylpyrimidine kinase